MSDTSTNKFVGYGTAAERGAFTPSPATIAAAPKQLYIWYETDTGKTYQYSTAWHPIVGAGGVVQVVNVETGAVSTGTTQIPTDDTIPQKTEGDEYMTLAVTPTNATNKLKIDVVITVSSSSVSRTLTAALFQDTTSDALAAGTNRADTGTAMVPIVFSHYMTAGTTSATTFKVRAGANDTGTTTFNGSGGGRIYGGVMASSITITEIAA